jgi:hypothetical protein
MENPPPIHQLNTTQMLRDDVVEAVINRVLTGCPDLRRRVAVFPSYFLNKAGSYSNERQKERFVASFKARVSTNLSCFVVCQNCHFFLVYARFRSKVVGFFDPKNIFNLFSFWNKLRDLFHLAGWNIDNWRMVEESHHPQGDSLNCGMFVIGRIFELAAFPHASKTKFREDMMPHFRTWAFKAVSSPGAIITNIGDLFNSDESPIFGSNSPRSETFRTPLRTG